MYSPVHQREFKERLLELTVWDQARVREEESQFLGEVRTWTIHSDAQKTFLKHFKALCLFVLCYNWSFSPCGTSVTVLSPQLVECPI